MVMPAPEPGIARIAEAVDALLLRDGLLEPVRLLQSLRLLPPDAELPAWPTDVAAANQVLRLAQDYCRRQGLEAVADAAVPRLPEPATPSQRALLRHCACVMRRAESTVQFDLFRDSRNTYAENQVRAALLAQQPDQARALLAQCEDPAGAESLAGLIDALSAPPAELSVRIEWLDREVRPLARRYLGRDADAYLAGLWAACAVACASQAYDPAQPELHASYAWLRAGDGERARASIECVPDWARHAALCSRHARSLAHSRRLAEARLAWMRLCWRHPQQAETALDHGSDDAGLGAHWRSFRAAQIEYAVDEFPAWMLLADPRHLDFVPAATAPATTTGAAYRALHALIRSDGDMDARRALHALRPPLLQAWLVASRPRG